MSKFIQIHFFYSSTFPLLTKQKGRKLKSFLFSHFFTSHHFLSSHFSTPPPQSNFLLKIAKQHIFEKYVAIYHYFGNMQGSTTFWVLEFGEIEFFMVLKFMELDYHGKNFQNFSEYIFSKNSSLKKVVRFLYISKTLVNC